MWQYVKDSERRKDTGWQEDSERWRRIQIYGVSSEVCYPFYVFEPWTCNYAGVCSELCYPLYVFDDEFRNSFVYESLI